MVNILSIFLQKVNNKSFFRKAALLLEKQISLHTLNKNLWLFSAYLLLFWTDTLLQQPKFSSNKLLARFPPPAHLSPVQGKCLAFISSWCSWFSYAMCAHLTLYSWPSTYTLFSPFFSPPSTHLLVMSYLLCILISWPSYLDMRSYSLLSRAPILGASLYISLNQLPLVGLSLTYLSFGSIPSGIHQLFRLCIF